MSNAVQLTKDDRPRDQHPEVSTLFRAFVGRFEDAESRRTIDDLVQWIEARYREDLERRPSKHVYIRTLPADVIEQIDRLRDSPAVLGPVAGRFGEDWVITPMKNTDELYISHYNKDAGGDQGLFDKHYDGNLRFLPASCVVRSLIYLQSDASYKVVFADSRVEKAFATYDFGILDFHRELHWVEGEFDPHDRQRILLKCNYLVAPRHAPAYAQAVRAANTAVFYVVKAAMEYSKSPRTPVQRVVGFFCNFFRRMNIVHPFVPFALIGLVLAAIGLGLHRLLG
jgi:hypothetical protein